MHHNQKGEIQETMQNSEEKKNNKGRKYLTNVLYIRVYITFMLLFSTKIKKLNHTFMQNIQGAIGFFFFPCSRSQLDFRKGYLLPFYFLIFLKKIYLFIYCFAFLTFTTGAILNKLKNNFGWSIPLTNVKWHSDPWPTVTSQPIRLSTNFMTLIPSLTFTDYEWFPWSICNGCGMPAGNAYPSGHLVPSLIVGLSCAPIV